MWVPVAFMDLELSPTGKVLSAMLPNESWYALAITLKDFLIVNG